MRLGIGTYTYTWSVGVPGRLPAQALSARDLLNRAAGLGIGVVQFCDNLPLTRLAPSALEDLTSQARALGITVEVGTRGIQDPANLMAYLELAQRFMSPFVRVVVDSPNHEPSPEETIRLLRPIVGHFAPAGVKLAIENHDRFSALTLKRVVEELGPEHAGICLDTVNSLGALEGPEVVVRTLAPYALNFHVKDFIIQRVSSQMGFIVHGCAAGQGRLNVPWVLDQLHHAGREVNAIIELWTPPGATLEETMAREVEWARESVRYLRQFIQD